jgi:iron(III) transport system substrate-binding protein
MLGRLGAATAIGLIAIASMCTVATLRGAAAEDSWDAVVAAAKKEGELVIKGAPGKVYADVFTQGFKKKYPDIKVSYTGMNGFESIPKIQRERAAGIYNWDVYLGGTPSILSTLKPAGAFAPLKAVLRPDIVDDKNWRGGFDAGWEDNDKKFTYAYDFTVSAPAYVNWDVVKPEDFKSFKDLLKPEFAGKVVWDDPRRGGPGLNTGAMFITNFGEDFLAKLTGSQKIAYTNNGRQIAEWVVRGKYPIGLSAGSQNLELYWKQGLGKNVKPFMGDITKMNGGPGFGCVALMDRAPHPNAAKLYLNWLLSQEGQTDYIKSGRNSRRLDVKPGDPDLVPNPGVEYTDTQTEDSIPLRKKVSAIAKANIKK